MKCIRKYATYLVLWGMAVPIHAASSVSDVRMGVHPDKTRIVIDVDSTPQFKTVSSNKATRLEVNLSDLKLPNKFKKPQKGKGLIRSYQFRQLTNKEVLLTIDTKRSAYIYKIFPLAREKNGPLRLVVDIKAGSQPVANKQQSVKVTETGMLDVPLPFMKPLRRVVVIDPGHGGHDPGTICAHGVHEKDITLAVAKEMKAIIDKSGKYTAVLTRTSDQHLPLRYRFSVARELNANLLISLHADSNPNKHVKGVSVYTLSETASDAEAKRLASKENAADFLEDLKFASHEETDVKDILIDLSQTRARNNSVVFASKLMNKFHKNDLLQKNTHRSADFAVLKAPDVASVLIELGYLSNAQDQKRLVAKKYQRKLASMIVSAIDDYFEQIKS